MKTAIYIEDGVTQVVLTPETKFEETVLGTLRNNTLETKVMAGAFYDCRGGWIRQVTVNMSGLNPNPHNEESLIIRVNKSE